MNGRLIYSWMISTPKEFKRAKEYEPKLVKSAPSYLEIIPKVKVLDQKSMKVKNNDVKLTIKSYFPESIVLEAQVELKDILSKDVFELKDGLFETCKKIAEPYKPGGIIEEYSIFCVKDYSNVDEAINKNRSAIASTLKDEPIVLDEDEIKNTLSVNMSYGKNDMIIIDWDGAIIFDQAGEFDEEIDIIEIVNIQLLGLRLLDKTLGIELERLKDLGLENKSLLKFKKLRAVFKDVVKIRSESMLDLEEIEDRIKLYGDWYSGKLYDLVSKKLYIDRWSQSVNKKLDVMQQLYDIVNKTIYDLYLIILEATIVVLIIIELFVFL
ncbi:hypothetical protein FJZ53_01550 [Candidatus Woesearchaeota archaeon]|nr:hypothetical protein [Candidatus Woesearchaeota archaeon]